MPEYFSRKAPSIRLHLDIELLSASLDFSLITAAQLKIEAAERHTMGLLDGEQWEIPSIV